MTSPPPPAVEDEDGGDGDENDVGAAPLPPSSSLFTRIGKAAVLPSLTQQGTTADPAAVEDGPAEGGLSEPESGASYDEGDGVKKDPSSPNGSSLTGKASATRSGRAVAASNRSSQTTTSRAKDVGAIEKADASASASAAASVFTKREPPGFGAFTRWVASKHAPYRRRRQHPKNEAAADSPSSELERERDDDDRAAVERFVGPYEGSLPDQVRNLRRRRFSLSQNRIVPRSDVPYQTVSYKKVDTPVWHEKELEIHDDCVAKAKKERAWVRRGTRCFGLRQTHGTHDPMHLYHKRSRYMLRFVLVGIGLLCSILAWGIIEASERLLNAKLNFVDKHTDRAFVVFVFLNLLFAFLSFVPVAFQPVSGGSGIAEAKAVLNGINIPCCTALLTALCKGVSVIFSQAASLPVGLEGPLIFIGLSLGDNAQRIIDSERYPKLKTERMRRDLATVGTAAGVTSAFLSPVGGVLFAMEEGSSFWSIRLCWQAFSADVVCAILMFILDTAVTRHQNLWKGFDVKSLAKFGGLAIEEPYTNTTIAYESSEQPTYKVYDYLSFALFGIAGGIIGACWCELNRALSIKRKKMGLSTLWKGIELLVLVVIMSALIFYLPQAYLVCGNIDDMLAAPEYFRQFGCPDGQYNHLATLLLNPPGSVGINLLFYAPDFAFTPASCLIAGTVYLVMLLLFFGTSISMGIFIPFLFVGACYGRAVGLWWGQTVQSYAIVASVAMLAGVVRVLVSLTVIMIEATTLTYFVTPFMVTTIFARVTARFMFGRGGIYDIILQLRGIPFLEEDLPVHVTSRGLRAEHIMSPPPLVTLEPEVTVGNLLNLLKHREWEDVPVVDPRTGGTLVGAIARATILTLLEYKELFYQVGEDRVYPKALKFDVLARERLHPPTIEELEASLTEEDRDMVIDVSPYIQIAHNTFDRHGSVERAFELFRTLGLRHLIVTGHLGQPVGVITRTDLSLLEELGEDEEDQAQGDWDFRKSFWAEAGQWN